MSRRTDKVLLRRVRDGESALVSDELAAEEPLSIRLDGILVATTMRTPGHDFELAAGFCFCEGLLAGAPVLRCRYCGAGRPVDSDFNVVDVETGGRAPRPTPRLGLTTSACGVCGSTTISQLCERLAPVTGLEPAPDLLATVATEVRARQTLFEATGGVHAAAAFAADGSVSVLREDVGRHNAVDKVVGALLFDGALPMHGHGLYVSGRASFELVQKAWSAGFSLLVAVSAPSALAVRTATAAGLTLAGFARGRDVNVYTP